MPSKLGFGNTRKKSSAMPMYGKSQKNPVMMLGDLDKDGKMSGYESKRQAAAIYAQKADDAKKKKNK